MTNGEYGVDRFRREPKKAAKFDPAVFDDSTDEATPEPVDPSTIDPSVLMGGGNPSGSPNSEPSPPTPDLGPSDPTLLDLPYEPQDYGVPEPEEENGDLVVDPSHMAGIAAEQQTEGFVAPGPVEPIRVEDLMAEAEPDEIITAIDDVVETPAVPEPEVTEVPVVPVDTPDALVDEPEGSQAPKILLKDPKPHTDMSKQVALMKKFSKDVRGRLALFREVGSFMNDYVAYVATDRASVPSDQEANFKRAENLIHTTRTYFADLENFIEYNLDEMDNLDANSGITLVFDQVAPVTGAILSYNYVLNNLLFSQRFDEANSSDYKICNYIGPVSEEREVGFLEAILNKIRKSSEPSDDSGKLFDTFFELLEKSSNMVRGVFDEPLLLLGAEYGSLDDKWFERFYTRIRDDCPMPNVIASTGWKRDFSEKTEFVFEGALSEVDSFTRLIVDLKEAEGIYGSLRFSEVDELVEKYTAELDESHELPESFLGKIGYKIKERYENFSWSNFAAKAGFAMMRNQGISEDLAAFAFENATKTHFMFNPYMSADDYSSHTESKGDRIAANYVIRYIKNHLEGAVPDLSSNVLAVSNVGCLDDKFRPIDAKLKVKFAVDDERFTSEVYFDYFSKDIDGNKTYHPCLVYIVREGDELIGTDVAPLKQLVDKNYLERVSDAVRDGWPSFTGLRRWTE